MGCLRAALFVGWISHEGTIISAIFPNGSTVSIGTTYGSNVTITGISNANPAVATAPANGYANGDIVVVSSGWSAINDAPVRVVAVAAGTFSLESIDSTDTARYPTGGGAGFARKVLTWTQISQITDSATSGGEQQFFNWTYLEDGVQRQRPTFKNARSMQMTMDFDDSLPWHAALLKADRAGVPHVLRVALPNGSSIYYNVYVGFDGEPTLDINQNMAVSATFSFANPRSQRYGA